MSFLEVDFFFFLPVVLILYWILPPRRVAQNLFLVAVSLLFYLSWNWRLLWVLVIGACLDFLVLRYFAATAKVGQSAGARRRGALTVSLVYGLGTLAFFKYEGFFARSFNALAHTVGLGGSLPVLQLLLPLGISFFTLQRVGYLLDVYWDRAPPPRSFLDYFLFVCFFPQLAAGPISRGSELLVQLEHPRRLSAAALADGVGAFVLGYALKGWAADTIGQAWVDPVFAASEGFDRTGHALALVGYCLQVFGDFAGYSLLAIGIARLFGITLPVNFNYPFLSKSLAELWRRWHITLNRWLFDYIFTPLGTSRGWFRGRFDIAMLITFLASGLWHGASWTFVAWGLLQGFGMVVNRNWDESYRKLCRRDRKYVRIRQSVGYKLGAWGLTMSFFVFSLIPFRAGDMPRAVAFARGLFFAPVGGHPPVANALVASAFIVGYHLLELPTLRSMRDRVFALPAPIRGVLYGLAIAFLALKVPASAGTFIYQQF